MTYQEAKARTEAVAAEIVRNKKEEAIAKLPEAVLYIDKEIEKNISKGEYCLILTEDDQPKDILKTWGIKRLLAEYYEKKGFYTDIFWGNLCINWM